MVNQTIKEFRTSPPPRDKVRDRKERFAALNRLAMKCGAWIVSVPGDPTIRFHCLPGNDLPNQLREMGHELRHEGETERVLAHATTEAVVTEGSTRPSFRTTHAGIARVAVYCFDIE